jgi:eukaryotic-like serine/threonine-protein kinase
MQRRFEREAQVIAQLRSPHTVTLFDFALTGEGSFYYVMELLDGVDTDT